MPLAMDKLANSAITHSLCSITYRKSVKAWSKESIARLNITRMELLVCIDIPNLVSNDESMLESK